MEDNDKVKLEGLMARFTNEADKTVKLIEALREKAFNLIHKGENILIPELKQNVRKQAITELEELTEKLVSLNIDLELDCVECETLAIPYFNPGDDTVHKLKFLSGDNPWNFWLVDESVDTKGILKNILHKFQNNLLDPVKNPKAAQSVCFVDKNKAIRGIILQIQNEKRIKLVDCDSNLTKVVASNKLYKADADACCTHASVLRCTITEEPDAIELWKDSDLRDVFCNTLREATLAVKVVKRVSGSFPIFVVDIELHNEEEESTANLREWILGRLVPELKKLCDNETESICDYLSEESLSPYHKEGINNEGENSSKLAKVQNEELNNLNLPTDKISEKVVTHLDPSAEDNHPGKDIINNFESQVSRSSERGVVSSSSGDDVLTSSSKESLMSDCSNKAEPVSDSRLNCHSVEFRPSGPVTKKPDIPRFNRKYQNNRNSPQDNQTSYDVVAVCPVGLGRPQVRPQDQPWPFIVQPPQQVSNGWPYPQLMPRPMPRPMPPPVPVFVPVHDPNISRNNEVNVMAPEFVPRSGTNLQPQNSKVEFPKEPIVLRKSATLIKENENLLVMISHVESPSDFYVHFVNQSNKYLDKLYEEMFSYYTTREKVEFDSWRDAKMKLGKYCACKWPRDNHWYRAEVLDWNIDRDQVKVCFVDHGNSECVPLSCLQPLTKTFEKLSICSQACHLAKVHPVIKGQPWSEEAVDFFKSVVEVNDSRVYSITVVRSNTKALKQNSLPVLLYEGKATDNSKSINELLVEHEFAWSRKWPVEPASSHSSETYHSMDEISEKFPNDFPTLDCNPLIRSPNTSNNPEESPVLSESNPLFQASPDVKNVPHLDADPSAPQFDLDPSAPKLDPDFEHWDPLREDYESARNNIALDVDDACVAVSGYSARDEARICKFYARDGFCFKKVCYKEHSMPNRDGVTTDVEETYNGAFSQLDIPKPGEIVRLRITYVFNINLFYAQIEEKKGVAIDDELEDEAETLTSLEEYMNMPENVARMRGLSVAPSPGEMVLARERDEVNGTEWWYRARVITSDNNHNPDDDNPEVMFVDYGSTCTVSERDLRKMEKRYLHLPFQAIECSLANIQPLENDSETLEKGTEWLQEVLLGQVLSAKVYESEDVSDDVVRLQVLLQLDNGTDVGDFLVKNNICKPRPLQSSFLQYL